MLILIQTLLLVISVSCYNLSSVSDKDELWNALLRGEIGSNSSTIDSSEWLASPSDLPPERNYFDDDLETEAMFDDHVEMSNGNKFNITATIDDVIVLRDSNKSTTDEKQHVKREHTDDNSKAAASNNEQQYQTVLIDDFDKFIPQLMHVGDSETIQIDSYANGTKTIRDLAAKSRPHNVGRPRPGQTSLVIVFDGTGSMENCLIQLRSGAKLIVDRFANRSDNPIYNYVFVPFRDPRKYIYMNEIDSYTRSYQLSNQSFVLIIPKVV